MSGTGQELAKRNGHAPATVDPDEEPSAEWGWHGSFPRGTLIAGWVSTVFILLMLIGNHTGKVEDLWLVGTALVMAYGLIRMQLKQRRSWRQ
ncbi:DUF2631 domain-containing protein [Pseudonocardia eucalypti]|uniref:DUF2631 domain-containing protein n=1 Tax=Pseudonocardia eucalypti TaxID=648755 RepID=A0ABP9PJN6_9PSEU|nr:hypothetical protein [Pseudonocardia eucalypti]